MNNDQSLGPPGRDAKAVPSCGAYPSSRLVCWMSIIGEAISDEPCTIAKCRSGPHPTRRTLLRGQREHTPHAEDRQNPAQREKRARTEQKEHARAAKARGAGLMSAPGGASMHFLKSCAQSRGEIAPELTSQLPCPSNAAAQKMGRSRKTHKSCCRAVGKKKKSTSFRLSMSRPGWPSRTQMQLSPRDVL